jgi:tRNA G10  N-methylase Trm11
MRYIFILGRNVELSLEEVKSFLKRIGNGIRNIKKRKNAILVETEKHIHEKIINKLGGVLAFGEIVDIHKEELYFGTSNKMNYVIWEFCDKSDCEMIRQHLKRRLKAEGLKATEKKLGRMIRLQDGGTASTLSTKHIDEQFFVFDGEFGRINQVCDYEAIEKRDMQKPVRRSELSISPRLAKIMINLSEVQKGKLIDAFCGIGVILSEAQLQNIPVIGVDKDKKALEGARHNLEWQEFKDFKLIKSDSRKVDIPQCEVMVSEPDLGEILKKMPTKEKAEETLRKYNSLMIAVINNLKENISGRIVFTAPYIKTHQGRIGCDAEEIAIRTRKELVLKIPEFRDNQVVGREIIVLE